MTGFELRVYLAATPPALELTPLLHRPKEGYRCRYGLNPKFQVELVAGPLRAGADDETGEVHAVELDGHPFFVATLFQPERAALKGQAVPLVEAFVRACAA
jgi:CTP synthase (UTP-ammonia lyase)